ncbi:MAG: DUF3179 domain-containing protein [Bacteroidota bacterium]
MKLLLPSFLALSLCFLACQETPPTPGPNEWAIPISEVRDGGPGKDGIPSIDEPEFVSIADASTFLLDSDLVVGVKQGDTYRAYPHIMLDWHEIVNDELDDAYWSVVYCPLTGSATGWDRELDGNITTFGVSGLLYNTNIIPYDRESDSNWSQMIQEAVNGSRLGQKPNTFQVFETTWGEWKGMFPTTTVLSENTGFNRPYGSYPYGGYLTNEQLLFPISNEDDRRHPKDRVLGLLIGDEVKGFPIAEMRQDSAEAVVAIQDEFSGVSVVVVGSESRNFAAAFQRRLADGTLLDFEAVQEGGAIVLRDQEGNEWNVFGEAVSGPRQGQQLVWQESFLAYWLAWGAFYPGASLYES